MSCYVRSIYDEKARLLEVRGQSNTCWLVKCPPSLNMYYLPKSEYVEVLAPAVWVDVTSECTMLMGLKGYPQICHEGVCIYGHDGYRIAKVRLESTVPLSPSWAFLVERRTEGGQP